MILHRFTYLVGEFSMLAPEALVQSLKPVLDEVRFVCYVLCLCELSKGLIDVSDAYSLEGSLQHI